MRKTTAWARALCAGIATCFVVALAGCATTAPAASADADRKAANAQKRDALIEMEKQGQRD
jgi:hypothetical protein